jgi:hypothetical protein
MSDYNLLEEEWIPVLYQNGEYARLGIKKTLEDAHIIRQIATSNPMDRVALIRFLLAILYWCKGNPAENDQLPEKFPMEWFKKLEEKRDCFNLLGEGKRFYQDKFEKGNIYPITNLFQEIPSGNNPWHWRHSTDFYNGVCLACCALGLIRLPIYSLGNFKSKFLKNGINGQSPTYFIPIAETLYNTFTLNWRNVENLGDKTAWEDIKIAFNLENSVSLLTGLTGLFFAFRLVQPTDDNSEGNNNSCVLCNSKRDLIYRCYRTHYNQEETNYQWNDPFTIRMQNKKVRANVSLTDSAQKKHGKLVGGFNMDKPCEKQIKSLMDSEFSDQNVLIVDCVNSGLSIDTWERMVFLNKIDINKRKEAFEKWYEESNHLDEKIKDQIKEINKKENNIEVQTLLRAIRPHTEHYMQSSLNALFRGESVNCWNKGVEEYKHLMSTVASSLSPGFTCIQMKKRKAISETIPTLELKKDKKSKKIKERN